MILKTHFKQINQPVAFWMMIRLHSRLPRTDDIMGSPAKVVELGINFC